MRHTVNGVLKKSKSPKIQLAQVTWFSSMNFRFVLL